MQWCRNLFTGANAKKSKYEIIWTVNHHKYQHNVYIFTLASNEDNLLDIYPAYILLQKHYKKADYRVVGIACGYEEAVETARHIVEVVYQNTGTFNVREYFAEKINW